MALETITGFVTAYTRSAALLPGLRLYFIPTGNAVSGDHLFVTARVQATITDTTTGAFTVDLESSDTLFGVPLGALRYYPRIEWRSTTGTTEGMDFVEWAMRVPAGGGTLEHILDAPTNPDGFYFSAAQTLAGVLADIGNPTPGTWIYWSAAPADQPNWYEVI